MQVLEIPLRDFHPIIAEHRTDEGKLYLCAWTRSRWLSRGAGGGRGWPGAGCTRTEDRNSGRAVSWRRSASTAWSVRWVVSVPLPPPDKPCQSNSQQTLHPTAPPRTTDQVSPKTQGGPLLAERASVKVSRLNPSGCPSTGAERVARRGRAGVALFRSRGWSQRVTAEPG